MISSWPERVTNHNGYEKTQTSKEGSSEEYFAMSASLTESFSVKDDSKFNYCKLQLFYKIQTLKIKASANFVPAAAVIREMRALFGIIGRKGYVDCLLYFKKNFL